jgi:hypothetical protein
MQIRIRPWAQLGLGAVLATGLVAGCNAPQPDVASELSAEAPVSSPEPPVSAPAQGGEGEGGVSIEAAAADAVVYGTALGIVEAHVLAARDAYASGQTNPAAEMFAHPVSEILYDFQPTLEARGVADFSPLLRDASAAVFAGESIDQINKRTDDIVAAIRAAAAKAPPSDKSAAAIAAGVAADQIERSVRMYRAAAEANRYEPYLDGYGFYKAGEANFLPAEAAITAENPELAKDIRDALDLLAKAYPSAAPQESLSADQSALTVASSKALLALSN